MMNYGIGDVLDHINYIRSTSKPITPEEFDSMIPDFADNCSCKEYLRNLCKTGKLRLVNCGSIHEVSNGIIGRHSDFNEIELKSDTGYDFDTLYLFTFHPRTMRIEIDFNFQALKEYKTPQPYSKSMYRLYQEYVSAFQERDPYNREIQYLFIKDYLVTQSEFVPFFIYKETGCKISHKKFRDKYGVLHDEVTSPCYGINIKKNSVIMKRLENWIAKGGYIKDDIRYLICEDRDTDDLYLRKYVE